MHRDIKPSNFLTDENDRLVLVDFGIALNQEEQRLTRTLDSLGTQAYMAPEQRAGSTVTAKADIYGFGLVLHNLIARTTAVPVVPGKGLAHPLQALVQNMAKRDPDERPTADEALQWLDDHGFTPAAQKTTPPQECG